MHTWSLIRWSHIIFPGVAGITEYMEQAVSTSQATTQKIFFFSLINIHFLYDTIFKADS